MTDVAVVGQVARDLVVRLPELPGKGSSVAVRERRELLGGKGANIAVGLAQLGSTVSLLGVVGDDEVGERLVRQAQADGIDTVAVVRRPDTDTGLIIDLVTDNGGWRYLEDLPAAVQLTVADVQAAESALASARCVVVQLQQPSDAALAAARSATGLVVLEGAPADDERRAPLLAAADVLRMDHHEAELVSGRQFDDADGALAVAHDLLDRGPSLVALSVDEVGNVFVWADGELVLPLTGDVAVDTTGGGDALTAGLVHALLDGRGPVEAAKLGVAAAGATVGHAGGRPDLT
jgi:ribokinase